MAAAARLTVMLAMAAAAAGSVVLVHDEAEFRAALEQPGASAIIVNGPPSGPLACSVLGPQRRRRQ